MEEVVKNEVKKTSKKAASSFAMWGVLAVLICCGGPLVLLALAAGGFTGFLGILVSNVYIVILGILISALALIWFSSKFILSEKSPSPRTGMGRVSKREKENRGL